MIGPHEPKNKDGWWLAVPAVVAMICCAGPALLAALGAGSVGALVGGGTGSAILAGAGLLLVIAVLITLRRKARR